MTTTERPEFTIVRTFDAPRDVLWRAWTDPALAARWWHPRGVSTPPESVRIDLREGGRYAYEMVLDETGERFPTAGVYREIEEPRKLVFTWGSPGDPDDEAPVVSVVLDDEAGDRTRMTFRLVGIAEDHGDQSVFDGWSSAFDVLDETLAG